MRTQDLEDEEHPFDEFDDWLTGLNDMAIDLFFGGLDDKAIYQYYRWYVKHLTTHQMKYFTHFMLMCARENYDD